MSAEFDPQQHEEFVSQRLQDLHRGVARVALFEEMMTFVDNGDCTFDQAVEQYLHDAAEAEIL